MSARRALYLPRMKKPAIFLLLAACTLLIIACGNKGPLVLPPPTSESVIMTTPRPVPTTDLHTPAVEEEGDHDD